MTDWGARAAERLKMLAKASEPGPGVTRLPYTPQHRAAIDMLSGWMKDAGLAVHLDAAGTLVGRLEGPEGSGTFYLGSHQDSVRHGGAFDGIMGVVLPILAIEKLQAGRVPLPFSVEVLAFADEEGVRFPTALVGSRALAGRFDPGVLEMTDNGGISLRQALSDFGLNPDAIGEIARPSQAALGYLEAHIEQGPVLEEEDQALGVVTAICGIERHQITLLGETGHAGTIPMGSRRDALVGASKIVTGINELANSVTDLRATVGALDVHPNVVNAVPGQVRMTVEIRSPIDATREAAGRDLEAMARNAAVQCSLALEIERSYSQPAQACDPALVKRLDTAVRQTGQQGLKLPSGATHDASAMADLCPMAMLFVRCRGGLSHRPEEYAAPEDLGRAVTAIAHFLAQY